MENWKAEHNVGQEEVLCKAKPSSLLDPHDQDEVNMGLQHSKEKAHTLIGKECTGEDVIRVWEEISKFIIFKMMEGHAVRISGLGTFTFKVSNVPVNQKTIKITKVPVFILSEHVASMYQLKQEKSLVSNFPTTALNLSVIANETGLPRGIIEGILTEVLQAFSRGIVCQKSLEFPFPFIGKQTTEILIPLHFGGKLQIRDQKVVMKFYSEFCKKLGFNVPKLVRLPEYP